MNSTIFKVALGAAVLAGLASTGAAAQSAEPTYKADPSVYKMIFEDANFRVIEVNRKKGVKDKAHGHPLPGIIYNVTDCKTKLYAPDGKVRDSEGKAGTANATPVTASHQAENVGTGDCKQLIVEKK
jgi:hypothetical protein